MNCLRGEGGWSKKAKKSVYVVIECPPNKMRRLLLIHFFHFRYCKNLRKDEEKAELKNFAAKRKRDFLGRGSVQTVSQPNIKCSKVSFMFIYLRLNVKQLHIELLLVEATLQGRTKVQNIGVAKLSMQSKLLRWQGPLI